MVPGSLKKSESSSFLPVWVSNTAARKLVLIPSIGASFLSPSPDSISVTRMLKRASSARVTFTIQEMFR